MEPRRKQRVVSDCFLQQSREQKTAQCFKGLGRPKYFGRTEQWSAQWDESPKDFVLNYTRTSGTIEESRNAAPRGTGRET